MKNFKLPENMEQRLKSKNTSWSLVKPEEPLGQLKGFLSLLRTTTTNINLNNNKMLKTLNHGLVVKGEDLQPRGRGLESWHWILDS